MGLPEIENRQSLYAQSGSCTYSVRRFSGHNVVMEKGWRGSNTGVCEPIEYLAP
jgi:hypothetical protein